MSSALEFKIYLLKYYLTWFNHLMNCTKDDVTFLHYLVRKSSLTMAAMKMFGR
jgi:hypothetical protein